ncbi:MAG: homocysteine S-methyltransferase [Mogibacterium sp.]|nr:homocysteine S-methyltransferase [Mogibacterium sp.]
MRKATIQDVLDKNGIMVIDGSMSTALEALGADNSSSLWTAAALAEQPELVKQVHLDYFRAGADCGITCSYQATIPGLMAHGYSNDEAEKIIADSVRIFLDAREEWWNKEGRAAGRAYPVCLAGIGPYGAYLADGSEYRGNYGVSDRTLYDFHRRRMEILAETGADVLLIETQPSLNEVLIEAGIAEDIGADYWISFSCRDGMRINEGDFIRDCAAALSEGHPGLKMIGVNCSKPEYITSLIHELRNASDIPVGVYPNSGFVYDPETKTWTVPDGQPDFGTYALNYMKAGASAVGGCCTTNADHIKQVTEVRDKYVASGAASLGYKGYK